LTAAQVQGSFFTIKFIRTARKKLIALELKLCPDNEFTPDILNYANDFNIYAEWVNAISGNPVQLEPVEKYHCAYIGRRQDDYYAHSHEEILSEHGLFLLQHKKVPLAFKNRLGTYGYLVRCTNLNTILSIIDFAHQE
jgi:hypothetical protein